MVVEALDAAPNALDATADPLDASVEDLAPEAALVQRFTMSIAVMQRE